MNAMGEAIAQIAEIGVRPGMVYMHPNEYRKLKQWHKTTLMVNRLRKMPSVANIKIGVE